MQAARRVADPAAAQYELADHVQNGSEPEIAPSREELSDQKVDVRAVSAANRKPPPQASTEDITISAAEEVIEAHRPDVQLPWWYTPKRLLVRWRPPLEFSDRANAAHYQQNSV